jgi:hypothetical protein
VFATDKLHYLVLISIIPADSSVADIVAPIQLHGKNFWYHDNTEGFI